MHLIEGDDLASAREQFATEIEARCAITFAAGCRLAATEPVDCGKGCHLAYDFVVLSPGESAPMGWTIYEERDGRAVGRSA